MKFLQGFWRLFRKKADTDDISIQQDLTDKEEKEYRTISHSASDTVTVSSREKIIPQKRHHQDKEKKPPSMGARKIELKVKSRRVPKSSKIFRKKLQKAYIQVGLDFGTSTTKVVFSQLGRSFSKALNFNHNLSSYPNYCLPSLCAINKKGELLLGIEAAEHLKNSPWNSGIQRLKVIVAGTYNPSFSDQKTQFNFENYIKRNGYEKSVTPERLTSIYLAYAMKISRGLIKNLPEYRDIELDLAFNICMPIDHLQNNRVCDVFKKIFLKAEILERLWSTTPNNFDPLKVSYDIVENKISYGNKVFAVPESVAALASYLISLAKQDGLHAVIDFGSGTTDVSICNLMDTREHTKSYWYAARNIPKGMIRVEKTVSEYLMECNDGSECNQRDIYNCINKLDSIVVPFEGVTCSNCKISRKIYEDLYQLKKSKEYYLTWGNAYRHLTNQTMWEHVTIFLTGGGSNLPYVQGIYSEPWWGNLTVRYPVYKLPMPDNYYPGESNAPFERMSVAYGLARPLPELDEFILPSDCPDHTPASLPIKERDHEDIYIT